MQPVASLPGSPESGSPESAISEPASSESPSVPPLGLATKFWFGVGQASEGMKNYAFNAFLIFYYSLVLGLDPALAGLAGAIALVFDAISDPVVGTLSDNLRHRWGRRHLFMYLAAVPLGVTFYLVWAPPAGLGQLGLFVWMLVWTVAARAAMTLYHVPHLALGADLSTDYSERTNIVAWRTFFGVVGFAGVAFGLPLFLFPLFPAAEGLSPQQNPAVYPVMGMVFGALMAILIVGSALGTHSRIPHLVPGSAIREPFSLLRTLSQMREAVSNPSFRALFVGLLIFYVVRGIDASLNIAMGTYFWEIGEYAVYLQGITGLAVLVGVPVWVPLSRRIDKKRTFIVGISGFGILVALMPTLKLIGLFPSMATAPNLYLGLLFGSGAVSGAFVAGPLVVSGSMLADIADEHEVLEGRRREGIFFGANSFSAKAASGIGNLAAGLLLSAIAFPLRAEVGTVDPTTLYQLALLYGPGSLGITLVALVIMGRYRLTSARYAEIRAVLDARIREPHRQTPVLEERRLPASEPISRVAPAR